jgi:hypothetical protein
MRSAPPIAMMFHDRSMSLFYLLLLRSIYPKPVPTPAFEDMLFRISLYGDAISRSIMRLTASICGASRSRKCGPL